MAFVWLRLFLAQMYDVTLHALKAARIERLWFIVSLKLARLHVDARRLTQACLLINELHRYACGCVTTEFALLLSQSLDDMVWCVPCSVCTLPGSDTDDPAKAAQLIELYAMRIEVCSCVAHVWKIPYHRVPKFLRMAQCVVHPLKGLACHARPSRAR